jgi:hypothetical protein
VLDSEFGNDVKQTLVVSMLRWGAERGPLCSLLVIGSHPRSGLLDHLTGSVAAATLYHFENSVSVIHRPAA